MKQKTFESRYRAALQGAGYAVQDVIDGEDFWVAYATHPSGFEVQVDCWPEEVTSVWGAVPIPPPVWKERGALARVLRGSVTICDVYLAGDEPDFQARYFGPFQEELFVRFMRAFAEDITKIRQALTPPTGE